MAPTVVPAVCSRTATGVNVPTMRGFVDGNDGVTDVICGLSINEYRIIKQKPFDEYSSSSGCPRPQMFYFYGFVVTEDEREDFPPLSPRQ